MRTHKRIRISQIGRVLFALIITLGLLPFPAPAQAATSTVSDDFETGTYSGGTGTWATNWTEVGDDGQASTGDIQIVTDPGGNVELRLDAPNNEIHRQVNTSGNTVALLKFDYLREGLSATDSVEVQMGTGGGGGSFTSVFTIDGASIHTDSSYQSAVIDITAYIGVSTTIQFASIDTENGHYVYFDNIEIIFADSPDLVLDKSDEADPIVRGAPFDYYINVFNQGTDATGLTMTDSLPSNLTFLGVGTSQGSCSEASSTVTCELGDLDFNTTADITITVASTTAATYSNTASVTLNETDGDLSNNSDTESTTVSVGLTHTCYASADSGNRLVTIDLSGPSVTEASSAFGVYNIEAIAHWAGNSTLYATDAGDLGTVDLSTGVFTAIGAAGSGTGYIGGSPSTVTLDDLDSLTFDPFTGVLWATHRIEGANDLLLQLNPRTGAVVEDAFGAGVDFLEIAAAISSIKDVDDAAISTNDGQLYAIQNNGGNTDHLIIIDRTNGSVTDLGQLYKTGPSNVNDMEGMGYAINGDFYGTTGDSSVVSADRDQLWKINPASALVTITVALDPSGGANLGDFEGTDCLIGDINTIAGSVFHDLLGNGIEDGSDIGTSGITIDLYRDENNDGLVDSGDTFLASAVTDANGDYHFPVAGIGNFVLQIDTDGLPANHMLTTDSVEVANFSTQGNVDTGNDFGHRGTASIGDLVWLDVNSDGVYDTGEPGLPNVTLDLTWAGPDGSLGTADDVTYPAVATDSNGYYTFNNLPAGNFQVDVDDTTLPGGLTASPGNGDPLNVALTAGQDYDTADFGYMNNTNAIIGDLVWSDKDANGRRYPGEPGLGGVTVALISAGPDDIFGTGDDVTEDTVTTAADGTYLFTAIASGTYIVDVTDTGGLLTGYTLTTGSQSNPDPTDPITIDAGDVHLKADFGYNPPDSQDNSTGDLVWEDRNGDGLQDTGEPGIPNVTAALIKDSNHNGTFESGEPIIAAATTDSSGNYSFSGVPDGSYLVWINDNNGALTGKIQSGDPDESGMCSTCDDVGAANLDAGGTSPTGVTDNTLDFGYHHKGSMIGDLVWNDDNGDGDQDAGEPGISGVLVTLYRDVDGDGVAEPDGHDNTGVVATTTTDINGRYSFAGSKSDSYFLKFALPSGYSFTTQDAAGDTVDSDPNTTTGATAVFTLGTDEIDVDLDAGLISTLDFGDLPAPYSNTILADDGERHITGGGLTLGASVDTDADGQESNTATGDTNDDGVTRMPGRNGASNGGGWTVGTVAAGQGGSLQIIIAGGSGYPQVFLDFGDGSGGASGTLTEVVLRDDIGDALSMPLAAGTHRVYFAIPGSTFGAAVQPIAGRIRLSSAGGLTVTGLAVDGEVEGHIWNFGPTAITLTSLTARAHTSNWPWVLAALTAASLAAAFSFSRSRRKFF